MGFHAGGRQRRRASSAQAVVTECTRSHTAQLKVRADTRWGYDSRAGARPLSHLRAAQLDVRLIT